MSDPLLLTFGDAITDHDWPSQCAVNVPAAAAAAYQPTAQQSLDEVQVTLCSESFCIPEVSGDNAIDHEVPFHCSIRAVPCDEPTAQQFDPETQLTELS